jgi:exodeoxyribonuclease X
LKSAISRIKQLDNITKGINSLTYNLIFLDTETTGIKAEDRLCQLAYQDSAGNKMASLFKPDVPIRPEASAINHITPEMLEAAGPFRGSTMQHEIRHILEQENSILVAHNAPFDIAMLKKEGIETDKFICSQRLFKWLDNGIGKFDSYSLQYLRYAVNIRIEAQAHDALGDILVLERVFREGMRFLREKLPDLGWSELIEKAMNISTTPMLLVNCPLKKYKGLPFTDVPKDYLKWIVRKGTFDEDILGTAKFYLQK